MDDISEERRKEIRQAADGLPSYFYVDSLVPVTIGELRALLNAADKIDQLRKDLKEAELSAEQWYYAALETGERDGP